MQSFCQDEHTGYHTLLEDIIKERKTVSCTFKSVLVCQTAIYNCNSDSYPENIGFGLREDKDRKLTTTRKLNDIPKVLKSTLGDDHTE